MDNVGIVVEDLAVAIEFFREHGLELEGQATIDEEWAGRVTWLPGRRVEIATMRTPDVSRASSPPSPVADHRNAISKRPRLPPGHVRRGRPPRHAHPPSKHRAQLVHEVVQYKDVYLLCYIRRPERLLSGLAQELG